MQVAVWLLVVVSGFFFSTSSPNEKNVVILTADSAGKVGQVAVVTKGGEQLLSEANQMTVVSDSDKAPSSATIASEEYINKTFAAALAALSKPPVKFVLYFQPDSTELDQASAENIPKVLAAIIIRESKNIGVYGHSDRVGAAEKNLELSLRRAMAIESLLLQQGVPQSHLHVSSHGEGNPLIPTPDGVAEPRNRRVEVIVR